MAFPTIATLIPLITTPIWGRFNQAFLVKYLPLGVLRSSKCKRNLSVNKDDNRRIALFRCSVDFCICEIAPCEIIPEHSPGRSPVIL